MDGAVLSARPADVFVGRQQELAILTGALAAVSAGEPRVVLIRGEAGIGKSALISEFLASHLPLPVVTASGDETEALLPYGLVQQLMAGGTALSAEALGGLSLLSQGPPTDADPLAVGVELLALMSSLQGSDAVALVIEDLQWIDLPSARALLFACRRLGADRVLVVLSCRTGAASQLGPGWERFTSGDRRVIRLTLDGLSADEISMLCRVLGRSGVSSRTAHRLREHTGGNALLVRAVLEELSDEALSAANGSFRPPRSLAEVTAHRVAALSAPARDFVAAAAVLGDHCRSADVAAVAGAADFAAALGETERAGLLLEREGPSGWQVTFPHLLIRQAVYDGLGAERRRALHLRAAETVPGEESLAHRSAAAVGPDPRLAAELDTAADRAARAGNPRLAAQYRQQSAAVTPHGPTRDERTLSSFELLVHAADAAQANASRPSVERLPASARRDAALGQLALLTARPLDAQFLLRAAWDAHDPVTGADHGAEAAVGLGTLLGMSGSFTEASRWLDRALARASGSEHWFDAARSMRAIPLTLAGAGSKALGLFGDMPERAAMVPAVHTDSLTYRGLVKLWTGDLHGAADDLATAAGRISAGLQVRFPGQPLTFLAEAEFRLGRWDDSQGHAELAVSLAHDADRHYDLPFVYSAAARVPACRGDWATAASYVETAEEAARTFGGLAEIFAASARSILGFARNDPAEVLRGAALALALPEIDYYDDPAAFWWRPLQIWALIRSGRLDDAATTLAALEGRAIAREERLALNNAAWLRGLLGMAQGTLEGACEALRQGCEASRTEPFPFHRALLGLEHGRCLSRLQQRKAAITALRAADEVFTALGARPFAQAARSELNALGVRPRSHDDPDLPGLTAQELRVARAVASGLSNREVAARLYLSPKTVEYHLSSVFAKLGVSSRHQLTARIHRRDVPAIPPRGKTQGNHGRKQHG